MAAREPSEGHSHTMPRPESSLTNLPPTQEDRRLESNNRSKICDLPRKKTPVQTRNPSECTGTDQTRRSNDRDRCAGRILPHTHTPTIPQVSRLPDPRDTRLLDICSNAFWAQLHSMGIQSDNVAHYTEDPSRYSEVDLLPWLLDRKIMSSTYLLRMRVHIPKEKLRAVKEHSQTNTAVEPEDYHLDSREDDNLLSSSFPGTYLARNLLRCSTFLTAVARTDLQICLTMLKEWDERWSIPIGNPRYHAP